MNPLRSLANERNVAGRIAFERQRMGWSYEGVALRMTQAGYPIQSTAVFKIEKGDPPRRVTVDELVGFSKVFDLDVAELLTPVDLVLDREARDALDEHQRALGHLLDAITGIRTSRAVFARACKKDSRRVIRLISNDLIRATLGKDGEQYRGLSAGEAIAQAASKPDPVMRATIGLLKAIDNEFTRGAHGEH